MNTSHLWTETKKGKSKAFEHKFAPNCLKMENSKNS